MASPGLVWLLAGSLFHVLLISVSANEDCLWYLDKSGSWKPGFDCEFFSFCCGDCHHRYCCRDPFRLFTERQQKHCMSFSPKMIAGIASAASLLFLIMVILISCFMCSCCYLYRRRDQMRTPYESQEMQMMSYPVQPAYPVQPMYPTDPKYGPPTFQQGYPPTSMYPPSGPSVQYPVYPPGPPTYTPTTSPPYPPPQPTWQDPEQQRQSGY
ncbi:protein shisa-4 isoform X1 [Pleurodeles waltl]